MNSMNNIHELEVVIPFLESASGSQLIYASENQRIPFTIKNKKYIYFLSEGKVDIHRATDDILLFSLRAPALLGIIALNGENIYHYLKTATDSKLISIEKNSFIELINTQSLWREIYIISTEMANFFFKRDERFNSKNVYNIIKNNLEVLWELPQNEREKISVFKFIMSRSNISRSSLNNILRELSDGQYIKINRGRLLDMKNLPERY
ncbi:hypothetical protein C2U51_07430 [Enterobacteriaceae bacterium ENNIH1]|nr:hypothetical protein C2U51_07430 [Enterobacteriaceae bacterium ENNIH1]